MAQDAAILQGGAQAVNFAPLWHDQDNPLERTWQALKHDLQKDAADWTFWIGFYEDLLAGRSMNWPLLHDIATTDTLDWSKGPIDLNADIMAFRDIWRPKRPVQGRPSILMKRLVSFAWRSWRLTILRDWSARFSN